MTSAPCSFPALLLNSSDSDIPTHVSPVAVTCYDQGSIEHTNGRQHQFPNGALQGRYLLLLLLSFFFPFEMLRPKECCTQSNRPCGSTHTTPLSWSQDANDQRPFSICLIFTLKQDIILATDVASFGWHNVLVFGTYCFQHWGH